MLIGNDAKETKANHTLAEDIHKHSHKDRSRQHKRYNPLKRLSIVLATTKLYKSTLIAILDASQHTNTGVCTVYISIWIIRCTFSLLYTRSYCPSLSVSPIPRHACRLLLLLLLSVFKAATSLGHQHCQYPSTASSMEHPSVPKRHS